MTRFVQVDAFTDRPFGGNPAAVMPLTAWLDDAVLQAIAAENNLSETAFLIPDASGAADYELRWFTPAVEVALCGHATLASGHVILSDFPERARVTFRTRQAGILEVARAGDGYAMSLPAWATQPKPLPETVAALGVAAVETEWRDSGYAIILLEDAAAVRGLEPDFAALRTLGRTLVIATAPGDETDVISRVFAAGAGIDEDPVTGSAHALLTPFWAARLGRAEFTAFQASRRGGRIGCRLEGDRAVLTGQCVTVIEGAFRF
ncbi:PhzF family phenazine biosynthesis protein [Sphingomonas jatrophae]|uniref:Phenazine biosynthesis protein PhzF family n=1 Tax=Sphingomonas jatrophae TaxID=1166337 RepID=A0A1I6KYC5_9SPHN|nr:PhzF family phenazine biosynthesis protein [Sphingomonas jatrophae]SFR96201.1 phenazine biosynthesis protein PhzF family [Sphingomonas jatrophae]